MNDRAGLKWIKIKRFAALFFRPEILETWFSVQRLEEVPIDRLILGGMLGVLVDADGTLGPHGATRYPEPAVLHVRRMREAGLKVALYTNDREDRFSQLPDIPVVTEVPPKPDPEGFRLAMTRFLGLQDPSRVCMIGDNYITDGGAVEAGLRFIHVQPVAGTENLLHKLTRGLARWRAQCRGTFTD